MLLILPLHPTRDAEAPSPTEPPRQVTFVQSRKDGLSDKPSPFVRLRLTILLHTVSILSSQKDAARAHSPPEVWFEGGVPGWSTDYTGDLLKAQRL